MYWVFQSQVTFSATIWSVLKSDFLKTKTTFFYLESNFTFSELKILQIPMAELLQVKVQPDINAQIYSHKVSVFRGLMASLLTDSIIVPFNCCDYRPPCLHFKLRFYWFCKYSIGQIFIQHLLCATYSMTFSKCRVK